MRREPLEVGAEHGEEYAGKYVFQELTWAKRSRIIQKHTRYHAVSGQVQSSDFVAIQAETIWASLKEQPQHKPVTLEKLLGEDDGVPIALGELMSKVVNGLCAMTREETAFLSAQSDDNDHPTVTEFRLCKEFGWTPTQLGRQPARAIHEFTVILNEVDRQAEEEKRRTEREARKHER
jgi:hypothetical protein